MKLVTQLVLVKVGLCLTRPCKNLHPTLRKAAAYLYLGGGKGDSKGWQWVLWPLLALFYSLLQEQRQRLDTNEQRGLQEG